MAAGNKRTLDTMDVLDDMGTLEDFFAKLQKGYSDILRWKTQQEKQAAENQNREVMSAARKFIQEKARLEQAGFKVSADMENAMKMAALKQYNEKKKREDVNIYTKALKEQYGIKTKFDKDEQKRKAKERKEENKELLANLKKLKQEGVELTKEQLEEEKAARKEIRQAQWAEATENNKSFLESAQAAMNAALNQINSDMETYTKNQVAINTRLMGSSIGGGALEKFGAIEARFSDTLGINPFFKTETVLENLNSLVEAGIVSNLEQRAFLQTAKDEIATTFDAADSALLRIIRLQQSDSTAARLGMESYLTKFLNNLVENTEYLTTTFDSVSSALIEASSMMGATQATEFEYVIQKWLGALSGTGLSESSATNLAQAIGYLGSGNIEALSGTNLLNLITMAATKSGQDIGALLSGGLDKTSANNLMQAIVSYMAELSENTSNVVKSELASTFGLTVSDLVAAKQLQPSMGSIYGNDLSYSGMYGALSSALSTMAARTPMAAMMDILGDNVTFAQAANIAKNPALAAIWKITDLIQGATGGINIPSLFAMGTGVDLNTTVENLIKTGIVGIGSLGMIGDIVAGLGNTINPSGILSKLDINPWSTSINRGTQLSTRTSGLTTSQSTALVRMNSSGQDIYSATLTGAQDSANAELEKMKTGTDQTTTSTASDDIKEYLSGDFDKKFTTLLQTTSDILDYMKNGEFEVKNLNTESDLIF